MRRITEAKRANRQKGGVMGKVRNAGLTAAAGATFIRLFLLRAKPNALPANVRLQPAW